MTFISLIFGIITTRIEPLTHFLVILDTSHYDYCVIRLWCSREPTNKIERKNKCKDLYGGGGGGLDPGKTRRTNIIFTLNMFQIKSLIFSVSFYQIKNWEGNIKSVEK